MSKTVTATFWCDAEPCSSHVNRMFEPEETYDSIPKGWRVDMSRSFHACSRRCAERIERQFADSGETKALLWLTHTETL